MANSTGLFHRQLQFNLRLLFAVVLLIAASIGLWVNAFDFELRLLSAVVAPVVSTTTLTLLLGIALRETVGFVVTVSSVLVLIVSMLGLLVLSGG